jgi:hypothetical protein
VSSERHKSSASAAGAAKFDQMDGEGEEVAVIPAKLMSLKNSFLSKEEFSLVKDNALFNNLQVLLHYCNEHL